MAAHFRFISEYWETATNMPPTAILDITPKSGRQVAQ
jgi:hypothetical protein